MGGLSICLVAITGYFQCLFQTISTIRICICFHSIFLRSLLVGQGEIFESCRICILFWQLSTGNWKLVCLAFERNHQINFSLLSRFILEKKQCLSVWGIKTPRWKLEWVLYYNQESFTSVLNHSPCFRHNFLPSLPLQIENCRNHGGHWPLAKYFSSDSASHVRSDRFDPHHIT